MRPVKHRSEGCHLFSSWKVGKPSCGNSPVGWQVHAYTAAPGGRTAYLAELRSGGQVLIADARGGARAALIGRVKVERRPLVRGTALCLCRQRCS